MPAGNTYCETTEQDGDRRTPGKEIRKTERHVDSRFQAQLEKMEAAVEDKAGWEEVVCGLWTMWQKSISKH